ncbi:hypothetical protein AAFF_G00398090 [Aldrovandia affinis]|uniref:Uncharacterized protein n=1 Tax=Aldrovandia affinis TaxID=143900 RepID=A0AAD7R417_9TELE|nr:hypothetical protein AAFF_G00398090 [Aldrovandia affinis]
MMYQFSTKKCTSEEQDLEVHCHRNLIKCAEEKKEIAEFFNDVEGGTIDITVYEVQQNGSLKELLTASGGGWGGTHVDQEFKAFLKEIFNHGVWGRYEREHPGELQKMMYQFSTKKCTSEEQDLEVHCHRNLIKCAEEKKEIAEFFNDVEGVS